MASRLTAGASDRLIYVASGAAAPGDGSPDHPYARPAEALAALKNRTAEERQQPTRIIFHHGIYRLEAALTLGAAESGTADAPVWWQSAGDGDVIFSGGLPVPAAALRPVTNVVTLARLPDSVSRTGLQLFEIRLADLGRTAFPELNPRGFGEPQRATWPELFQDGRPLPLAAWPNGTGYAGGFKPARIIHPGKTESSKPNEPAHQDMIFVAGNERVQRWKTALDKFHAQVWFGGHWFWDWADDFLPADAIGADGAVTIRSSSRYGMGSRASLHVYNLVEEMDQPGEYVLEPAQQRLLVLLPKVEVSRPLVLSWIGEPLLVLDHAANMRFEGLQFADGRSDGVKVTGGENIAFRHCVFINLGVDGLRAQGSRISVADCRFKQLGAGGVQLSGGDARTLTHADNVVAHCEFGDFSRLSRTYTPAVGLRGVGMTVENCLMYDAPHSAILFGGQEMTIRNNEIHHVLTETGDCGAIYCGRDWTAFGTVIAGNWIHDLGGNPGRWPCGIYLDDQISGLTVTNNLIERAALGFLIGGGRYDLVEGNIVAHCQEAFHLDSRGTGWARERLRPTLDASLAKIPASAEPWKSRYPMVQDTLKDQPEKPVGTRIIGNAAVGCTRPWHAKAPSGVAVVSPNWEGLPATALKVAGKAVKVEGTPLVFVKPEAGVRP